MRRSRSDVHERPARVDEAFIQPLASTEIPGDPRTSEFHLGRVMDSIPALVWAAAPDGDIEFCNRRWLDYTGMSLEEVRGGGWAAAMHPQDSSGFRDKWQAALTEGMPLEAEARIRRVGGAYRWVSIRAVPLRDAEGGITRWYGTNTDIEELKRAQDDVLRQTSRLDELFEQTPEAVALLSTDERVVRINREFTRIFGYEPDEVLQRPIYDLIVPEVLVGSAQECMSLLNQGGRVEVETVCRRKDGSEIYVSLLAVPVTTSSGDQLLSYAIYRDITARKRAEEQLRESEARFQAMADTAPVMIWMTGTDGLCNYFNKPWLEFTGRTMEQEVGTGWIEGVHPDDVQGCFDGFLPAFHARKSFRMQYRLRRVDGEYRWVIESGIPRYTSEGEFAGYIGSNIDITDLKRAEEERERLRQVQADLAHVSRVATLGEVTASLAHEINQPIAAAIMNARACVRWLQGDAPDMREAGDAASRMVRDATRVADIVDRVRSLYRRGAPTRELVDMNEIIREMIVLFNERANRHSISIRTELDAGLPTIAADRVQLQQVLMNLIFNGIEAMKDTSGELTVTSKRIGEEPLLISVSDLGVGLPVDETERIFEPFFTTKPQGTGMGLSISRRIIESHGGRLWASANSGRGATFQFTLPQEAAGKA